MSFKTNVNVPEPPPPTEAETENIQAQTAQLRNLERIQTEQLELFRRLAPLQEQGLGLQTEAARLQNEATRRAAEEAGRTEPLLQRGLEIQLASLEESQRESQRRATLDRLTTPILLEQAGFRAVTDSSGNIVDVEPIPQAERSTLQVLQDELAEETTREALRGVRGEIPVGGPFETRITQDRRALEARLRDQLGPGFATSTPGIQALAEFEARAAEARENIRFGRLTQSSALANLSQEAVNRALLRDLDILQRERTSTLPATFGLAAASRSGAADALAQSQQSLAQQFAFGEGLSATTNDALLRAAGFSGQAAGLAGNIAEQFAGDRRIQNQAQQQAAIQSAMNRAQTTAGLFNMFGTALGAAGSAAAILKAASASEVKENNVPVDADEILEAIRDLRVERWNYRPETGLGGEEHIGPYAEEFLRAFGVGDGKSINFIDAIGVLFAAVKALAGRLEKEAEGA